MTKITGPAVNEKLFTANYMWSFLGNFLIFFAFYMLLPILPIYLADQFQADRSLIGIILASYTITALLIRPFAGFLVDSFPRKLLLIICYVFFVGFFGGYILAGTVFLFAILRASHGVAFGMVTISSSTVAIDVMPASRRNEGIGYFALSANTAMAIGPMSSLYIFDLLGSYHIVFLTTFIAGIIGLFCVMFIKTPPFKKIKGEPVSWDRFFLLKGLPAALNLTLFSFSYGILTTYVAVYGTQEVGMESGTGLFFVVMAIGLFAARALTVRTMRQGALNQVIITGSVIMTVGYIVFIFLKNEFSFYLAAVLLGTAYGYIFPAFQTMFINLASHSQRGTANSTFYIAWDMGIGIGVLIGGQIADMLDYTASYIAGLVLVFVGILLFSSVVGSYYLKHKCR